LQFTPCFVNITLISAKIAIVKQQIATQKMFSAFFARDLAVSGHYTLLLSNHFNYPIAYFLSILITLFLFVCFYSHFFGNTLFRQKERLLYIRS